MRKVLIFKETLLPRSETFILAQATALKHFHPTLAGLEPVADSLPIPPETLLLSRRAGFFASTRAKLYRRTGIAPLFHRELQRCAPSLVHAHFASGGRTALHLARALGVPLIVTLHGSDVTVRAASLHINDALGREAALFLCVSGFIRDCAMRAGLPAEKLLVHEIGIDRTKFDATRLRPASTNVLFIGRLVEKKGCEYLLRAMQLVQQAHPDAALTILGDGPLRPSLQKLAVALGLRCEFAGVQPASRVRSALQASRVFCLPSVTAADGDSEGLPTVVAEAQAMGLPVVASRHAGIPEIVMDGVTGILTAERDHQAIAAGICLLLDNDQVWTAFSIAAQDRIQQHFDLHVQTALLEDIYNKVAEGRRL